MAAENFSEASGQRRESMMAISFAAAVSKLTAATGLDKATLLHIGDSADDVAANLTALTESHAATVALGPAREQLIAAFVKGWRQEVQAYEVRLRVGTVEVARQGSNLPKDSRPSSESNEIKRPRVKKATPAPRGSDSANASGPAVLSQAKKDDLELDKLIREVIATAPALLADAHLESGFFTEFGQHESLESLIRPVFLKRKGGGTLTPQGVAKCWRGFRNFLQFLDEREAEPTNKADLCLYFKTKRDQARKHQRSVGSGLQASKSALSHLEWAARVFRLDLPLADELVRAHAAGIGTVRKVLAGLRLRILIQSFCVCVFSHTCVCV